MMRLAFRGKAEAGTQQELRVWLLPLNVRGDWRSTCGQGQGVCVCAARDVAEGM